jgi:hypothetical protein
MSYGTIHRRVMVHNRCFITSGAPDCPAITGLRSLLKTQLTQMAANTTQMNQVSMDTLEDAHPESTVCIRSSLRLSATRPCYTQCLVVRIPPGGGLVKGDARCMYMQHNLCSFKFKVLDDTFLFPGLVAKHAQVAPWAACETYRKRRRTVRNKLPPDCGQSLPCLLPHLHGILAVYIVHLPYANMECEPHSF